MGFSVLIVDDDADGAHLLTLAIADALGQNTNVKTIGTVDEFNLAVPEMLSEPPDAIVLDMTRLRVRVVPNLQGAKLCIQELAKYPDLSRATTAILWSAFSHEFYFGPLPAMEIPIARVGKFEGYERVIEVLRTVARTAGKASELSQQVFLVHGRNEGVRDSVARVIRRLIVQNQLFWPSNQILASNR